MNAILFDWMGVIFKEPDVIGTIFPRIMKDDADRSGLSMEEMRSRYYPYSEGKLSRAEFWRGFRGEIADLEEKYLQAFELNEEYCYVESLRGKFKLGIVSNFPAEWGDYLIAKYEFCTTFAPIVVSGSVGWRKPHPEIYRIASRGLGTVDGIYVVDDKTCNLKVVEEELGWEGIWMRSRGTNTEFMPSFQIKRLSELGLILPSY